MIDVDELIADDAIQFEQLQGTRFPLDDLAYNAAQACRGRVRTDRAWQVYLNELAQVAFADWLQEWVGMLPVQIIRDYPLGEWGLENRCYLQVGTFKVCLVVDESFSDHRVSLAEAAFTDPVQVAHLYVALEIWEVERQASFRGFLRYDCRQSLLRDAVCVAGVYHLPLRGFDPSPRTLLWLLYLAPAWSLDLSPLPITWQQINDRVRNVAHWWLGVGDAVTQSLCQPRPLTPVAVGWRDQGRGFEGAIATLIQQGMPIPSSAHGITHPLTPLDPSLELLIAAWPLSRPVSSPSALTSGLITQEWSLLAILGKRSGPLLPSGIRLQIEDQDHPLSDQTLTSSDSWLVARVEGHTHEQFLITITLETQAVQLGPFIWDAQASTSPIAPPEPNSYYADL